jgi:methionine aminopeptidase
MTKTRAPLSFSLAITTVAGVIGWQTAARITRRSVRTIRHWSESDRHGAPTLDQAIALDRAYVAAGGAMAPILASYMLQMDVAAVDPVACRTALAEDIALLSRETGDAISHCIQALQPGSTPAEIHRAIAETQEADAVIPRLLGRLKALLPGNGAGAEARGHI